MLFIGRGQGFLGVRAKRGRAARAATELGLSSSPDRTQREVGDDGWGPPVGETERAEGGLGRTGLLGRQGGKTLGRGTEKKKKKGERLGWAGGGKRKEKRKLGRAGKGEREGKGFPFLPKELNTFNFKFEHKDSNSN